MNVVEGFYFKSPAARAIDGTFVLKGIPPAKYDIVVGALRDGTIFNRSALVAWVSRIPISTWPSDRGRNGNCGFRRCG
jgi:hypothetical protein